MTWQCFTKGAGYTCVSSAPGQVTLTKGPGCGSFAASSAISVPSGGGKITFKADIRMSGWTSQIRMEIVSGLGGIGSGEVVDMISRGFRQSNKAYTVDVSKYAGKNVAFVISGSDTSDPYCYNGDHNFGIVIRDFKVIPASIIPQPPVPTPPAVTPSEKCCDDVCFSELVNCYEEGGYRKAHGWTASTGQSSPFMYHPPSPWEYDPSFSDTRGAMGAHGGCSNCVMTLVHLRKLIAPPPLVCHEGAVRSPETCWNGYVIHQEVCRGNRWVPTGQTCLDPAPMISRLQAEVRALEAQVADLQREIAGIKTRYGI